MNIFKFKSNNEDLGSTLLENVFINHYMPTASGDFVKVYILGLKYSLSQTNNALSNEVIAKTLNISEEDVTKAWKYWEEQGIIRLCPYMADSPDTDFVIEFLDIKEKMLNIKAIKKETGKYSPDRIISARQNYKIKDMFEYLRRIMGRELSQNEMFVFLDWIDDYHMTPEVVTLIIDDCLGRGKKDLPYLKQVAKYWFDAGAITVEKANEYLSRHKEKWQKYSKVLNFLRVGRQPTVSEEEMLFKWFFTLSLTEELVLKGCEVMTGRTMKPSFSYLDKILVEWHEKKLLTIEEVDAAYAVKQQQYKGEKSTYKEDGKAYKVNKPTFNNFQNRTYDPKALEDMLLKKSRSELNE